MADQNLGAYNIADLREIALRRVPKGVFEFVDRGTEDEVALRNNRVAFERIKFRPRTLVDVSGRSQEMEIDRVTALIGCRSVAELGAEYLRFSDPVFRPAGHGRPSLKLLDYEILARVSLAAMIDVPAELQGREREQRLRALAQHVVDCVVCSKDMQVMAAVDLEAGSNAESRFKSECLKAAGVRYRCVSPAALPKREEVRVLLLGEGA